MSIRMLSSLPAVRCLFTWFVNMLQANLGWPSYQVIKKVSGTVIFEAENKIGVCLKWIFANLRPGYTLKFPSISDQEYDIKMAVKRLQAAKIWW